LTEDQVTEDLVANAQKGHEIPRVRESTASWTAQYSFDLPVPDWQGAVRLEGSYTDESFTELSFTSPNNRLQESYSIFNARANFRNDSWDLDLALFIENIADEDGDVFIGTANGQPTSKVTNRPRTIGVRVTKGFGRN
jgi:hypothetical protein